MVLDQNDIPHAEQVKMWKVCGVGHPGVCKERDRGRVYTTVAQIIPRLTEFVFRSPGISVGQGIRLAGYSEGVAAAVKEMTFIVAYVRKADPALFIAAYLEEVQGGPAGRFRLVVEDSCLKVALHHRIAAAFARQGCSRVTIAAASIASVLGSLRDVTAAPVGQPKDIFGPGVVGQKKAEIVQPTQSALGSMLEKAFLSEQTRSGPTQKKADDGVVSAGAVVPKVASSSSSGAPSGQVHGPEPASSSGGPAPPPPPPPDAQLEPIVIQDAAAEDAADSDAASDEGGADAIGAAACAADAAAVLLRRLARASSATKRTQCAQKMGLQLVS